MAALSEDEATRNRYPTPAAIEAAQDRLMQHFQREGIPADPLTVACAVGLIAEACGNLPLRLHDRDTREA